MGGSSYISHFVCLYNFNYTGRPLRGPGIIGIILHKLRSKYMRKHKVEFSAEDGANNRQAVSNNWKVLNVIIILQN